MELKYKEFNSFAMIQYNAMLSVASNKHDDEIKSKVLRFKDITNKENAKKLYKELFSDKEGQSAFFVKGVEVKICDTNTLFSITADFNDEVISYAFA